MRRRAAVVKADPSSAAAFVGEAWIVLVSDGSAPIRRGRAPMLQRFMDSPGTPSWSFHATHATALAYALEQVGLGRPESAEKRA